MSNILRCYFIHVGILSNSMFIYRNLTRGVGRFRELLRAVETRTTQNLRMVSYIKSLSYCSIWISVGRESISIVDELETNSWIQSIWIRTCYPTLYKCYISWLKWIIKVRSVWYPFSSCSFFLFVVIIMIIIRI